MNKIKFDHKNENFVLSLGISKNEINDMLVVITNLIDTLNDEHGSMSKIAEQAIKTMPFKMRLEHYIALGLFLEKIFNTYETKSMIKEMQKVIQEVEREVKLESTLDKVKDLIKN